MEFFITFDCPSFIGMTFFPPKQNCQSCTFKIGLELQSEVYFDFLCVWYYSDFVQLGPLMYMYKAVSSSHAVVAIRFILTAPCIEVS